MCSVVAATLYAMVADVLLSYYTISVDLQHGNTWIHRYVHTLTHACIHTRAHTHTPRRGDWLCTHCDVNCFGTRTTCFKCGRARPDLAPSITTTTTSSSTSASSSTTTTPALKFFERFSDVPEALVYPRGIIRPTMFPQRFRTYFGTEDLDKQMKVILVRTSYPSR